MFLSEDIMKHCPYMLKSHLVFKSVCLSLQRGLVYTILKDVLFLDFEGKFQFPFWYSIQ